MVNGTTGSGELETSHEINLYIERNKAAYQCCVWAKEINPEAGKCYEDCPFPYCVMADIHPVNKYVRPKIVEQFKNGQTMMKTCDLVR